MNILTMDLIDRHGIQLTPTEAIDNLERFFRERGTIVVRNNGGLRRSDTLIVRDFTGQRIEFNVREVR